MINASPSLMPKRRGSSTLNAVVLIDYQNVHITGWEVFSRDAGVGLHEALLDPAAFAKRLIAARNAANSATPPATLDSVKVFRGLPSSIHDPDAYRRNQDQKRNWESDGVEVTLRPLKYRYQRDGRGKPIMDVNGKKTLAGPPEEKGVDLMVGLATLLAAQHPDIDLVVLASHDSDMGPVVDTVHDLHVIDPKVVARIETASWFVPRNDSDPGFQSKIQPGLNAQKKRRHVWNTRMGELDHIASLDTRLYR
ncbi:hypothetical protein [Corynebacterium coyleae]|uniref:hypothetical protein n=1 Tax=Corynebacterium coyleae TaxID=53374 RepID=UPI00254F1482|nr:hypothetical protein [Corynebacterium coyleae]MDK8800535.1 hypothetical protein [Corynebacterium coyleae]